MWNKSFSGVICGLIFFIFMPSALSLLFKQHIALMLALTIVVGISFWAGIMTWCYAAHSGKQAWLRGSYFAFGSLALYGVLFVSLGAPQ